MSAIALVSPQQGAALAAPPPSASLYELEDSLQALIESADTVEPAQEEQFLAEVGLALQAAAAKRDRVAQFLTHLDAQCDFADSEMKRLRERKASFQRVHDRLSEYVVTVIQGLGTDPKGKYRKLEGHVSTLAIRVCPPSVMITEEALVPLEFQNYETSLAVEMWTEILDALPDDLRYAVENQLSSAKLAVRKVDIKTALQHKRPIPGATLINDKYRLEVK